MFTQKLAKLLCALRQCYTGTAIFIGDPSELCNEN
jgi:hypothetical protein